MSHIGINDTDFIFLLISLLEQKIDIEHVPKLIAEKDMLRELIPNIGDRLNFISKYDELFSKKKDNVSY